MPRIKLPPPEDLVGLPQMAREVGFSRATLELDVARGVIPAIRIAGRTFVTKQAVAEYARTKQRRRGAKSLTPTSA